MKTTLLNPFSIRLKKPPFMEMRTEPTFENGDFKIYRYCDLLGFTHSLLIDGVLYSNHKTERSAKVLLTKLS